VSKGRKGRSPDHIRKDRAEIARLYLQGNLQHEIGEKLGLSRQQIGYELKAIRKEWLASSLMDFNQKKAEELARIDRMEAEAWVSWETSKGQKETTLTEQTTGGDGDKLKAGIRKEAREGSVDYLKVVQWCINKRCEILGLDAPRKIAPTTPDGQEPYRLTVEDFVQARNQTEEWRRERFNVPRPGTN
jgi:hypothetical protein